jgi:hypothetical protein
MRRFRLQDGLLTTGIGEMSMPRQRTAHRHPRSKTHQLDLFARPDDSVAARTPEWGMLPAQTRQALTGLMVRLILDHADGERAPDREERRHDD